MNHNYKKLMRCIWPSVVLAVLVLAVSAAAVSVAERPEYVSNQLMIRFAPGTTEAERNAAAESLGGRIVRASSLANTYLIELDPGRGVTVEAGLTRAAQLSSITDASPNYYRYKLAVPNDPRFSQQWGMRMINAPKAWDLERGSNNVIVAVIDDGIDRAHPEFQNRLLPGYDIADGDDNPSHSRTSPDAGHGTHVTGIIAAQGNNGQGVVGVCWDNVKILPVKVFPDAGGGAATFDIVEGLEYAKNQGAQVVNMSLGSRWGSKFEHDKIKELYAAGIILCAAAGNDSGAPVCFPAAYDEVIAVSAVRPDEQPAVYTNIGPEIDIAAPGGQGPTDDPDTIWSTAWRINEDDEEEHFYAGYQGTSMACPHVAGAAALLLSAGVPPSKVPGQLFRGARAPITGVLDPIKYGRGILDLHASLRTDAELEIISPTDGQVIDTTTPIIKVSTYLVRKDTIKFYLDYSDMNKDGVPDDLTEDIVFDGSIIDSDLNDGSVIWDGNTGILTVHWPPPGQAPFTPGTHTLCVIGNPVLGSDPTPVRDSLVFFVQPRLVQAGKHLLSIPYPLPEGVTPYQLFGTTGFRLARFVPSLDSYATVNYPGVVDHPLAWPSSSMNIGVHPHGSSTDTPPSGLGFWVELDQPTPIIVTGNADVSKAYDITLTRGTSGWNMIGNPFPFPVPWESVKVTYHGTTKTLTDAVANGWIRPALYRYTKSGYSFQTPPDAVLVPWEGHWVKILPDQPNKVNDQITLIVPPVQSGTIVETPKNRSASTEDEWSFNLEARSGSVVDAFNIVGISSRAADGFDLMDVEEPPTSDNYVQLSFVHNDWSKLSGRYASDFRSSIGTGKTWEFEVSTDMPNRDITIAWPGISTVPKNYDLVLEDLDSGNRSYMRTRSAYTYNSGSTPGVRRFKLSIQPAGSGALMVTNVTVTQTKGSSINIGYTISRDARVEVRIRDSRNRAVRTLAGNTTRAAGLNSVHWDCTFEDGSSVPSGLYAAEIIATGPDGEVAKIVRPILVR